MPLCAIVSDCMVYSDPKIILRIKDQEFRVRINQTIRHNQKTKKAALFFSEVGGFFLF